MRAAVSLMLAALLLAAVPLPAVAPRTVPLAGAAFAAAARGSTHAAAPGRGGAPPAPVMCPDEPGFPAAYSGATKCGAACQTDTRAALITISAALMPPDVNFSYAFALPGGGAVNFTAANCNGEEPGSFCNVRESVDILPGDPLSYLFGGNPDSWLPVRAKDRAGLKAQRACAAGSSLEPACCSRDGRVRLTIQRQAAAGQGSCQQHPLH